MEIVNIIGHSNLIRDLDSKAILNTDLNAIQRYKMQSKPFETIQHQMDEMNTLKQDVEEIKAMMGVIMNKLKDLK